MGIFDLSLLPRIWRKEEPKTVEVVERVTATLSCPNCGSDQFYEGPSGGASVNIECAGCSLWFSNTPMGLRYIHEHQLSRAREIKWGFCDKCEKMFGGEFFRHASGGEYPKCNYCGTPLTVCWIAKSFPQKECDICDIRFRCYTER